MYVLINFLGSHELSITFQNPDLHELNADLSSPSPNIKFLYIMPVIIPSPFCYQVTKTLSGALGRRAVQELPKDT